MGETNSPGGAPSQQLDETAIGRRVSIRLLAGGTGPSGGPAMRDVVGVLESVAPDGCTVRRKDGTTALVQHDLVVSTVVLAHSTRLLRSASDIGVAELEHIAAAGWRPIHQQALGDWVLRASSGFTKRANSVLPLGASGLELDQAIGLISQWYVEHELPVLFQLPSPDCDALSAALTARGWTMAHPTLVLVADVAQVRMLIPEPSDRTLVEISDIPSAEWLMTYQGNAANLSSVSRLVLTNTDHPTFATVLMGRTSANAPVAVARAALTGSWIGLSSMTVSPSMRRRGFAHQLVGALVNQASRQGARHVYLQVEQDNVGARALYDSLGFTEHHRYQYARRHGA